jgi:hypothetical protein
MANETEKLIDLVHNYPYLYDTSHCEYKKIVTKAEKWNEIAWCVPGIACNELLLDVIFHSFKLDSCHHIVKSLYQNENGVTNVYV